MRLNSIQANEVTAAILRPPEKNDSGVDGGKRSSSASPVTTNSGLSASTKAASSLDQQAQALCTSVNYIKNQLDEILVNYPPWFPVGSYQRIELIKAVRGVQEQVEKSSVQSELKGQINLNKLSDDASDGDISIAFDQLLSLKDELSQNLPAGGESPQPGALVSIKV